MQVTEHVTIELSGPSFFQALMSSDEMTQLIKREELFLIKGNNNSYIMPHIWKLDKRPKFWQFLDIKVTKYMENIYKYNSNIILPMKNKIIVTLVH